VFFAQSNAHRWKKHRVSSIDTEGFTWNGGDISPASVESRADVGDQGPAHFFETRG
jgi:hypothetical protein